MSVKFDSSQQGLVDRFTHDLPEDLAACVTFGLHEGGDGIDVSYPKTLHGTPDFQTLDRTVRGYGGTWVSQGAGKPSYFLIPRPRPKFPAEAANEFTENARREAEQKAKAVSKPQPIPKPEPQPAASVPSNTPNRRDDVSCEVKPKSEANSQGQTPKQPSPIDQFITQNCAVCQDYGVKCSPNTDAPRRQYCLEILKLRDLQASGVLLAKLCLTLENMGAYANVALKCMNDNLEKLANRPVYSRGGGKPQQAKEFHVDGGIKWCWNQAHTYEQAWGDDNKDSKEYTDLKAKLSAAKEAGKKGVFIGDYWVFLDGYGKDAVLRKKTQEGK